MLSPNTFVRQIPSTIAAIQPETCRPNNIGLLRTIRESSYLAPSERKFIRQGRACKRTTDVIRVINDP